MPLRANDTMFLETTEVPALKSMGEITSALVKAGAREISTTYGDGGKAAGIRWSMWLYDRPVWFVMPAKTEAVYTTLYKRKSGSGRMINSQDLRDKAERVAWRQLLMWVKVQLALIEHGMTEYAQAFFPYMSEGPGSNATVWDMFREQKFKAIEAPKQ